MRQRREARLVGLVGLALWACAGAREVPPAGGAPRTAADAGAGDAAVSRNVISPATDPWRARPLFAPGSRLRAHVQDGGGDAVAFLGLYDTELDFDCNFQRSEDGAQRCLPGARVLTFLDPACTRPVFRSQLDPAADSCIAPSAHELASLDLRPSASCNEAYLQRVYRTGASRPAAQVYVPSESGCMAAGVADCLYDFEAMPPNVFVRGELERRRVDHGLAVEEIAYADGARVIARVVDESHDASCAPVPEVAGDRCLPVEQAHDFGTMFRDAKCSGERVAIDPSHAEPCGVAKLALSWETDVCGHWHMTAFELGERVDVGYTLDGASCSEFGSERQGAIYQLGAMLDVKSFPALRGAQALGPRLALSYFTSMDGLPLTAAKGFTDRQLDRACLVETFSDGNQRCVPRTLTGREPADVGVYGPFLDVACKERALAWQKPREPCVEVPDVARIWPADSSHVDRVARVGRRVEDVNTIYVMNGGACVPSPSDPDSDYYAIDRVLDLPVVNTRVD